MNIFPIPETITKPDLKRQLYFDANKVFRTNTGASFTDPLIPRSVVLGGAYKQNNLTPDANIVITEQNIIETSDHIHARSLEVSGRTAPRLYKNLVTISSVENTSYIPLLYRDSSDFMYGELLMKVKLHGDTFFNHHYMIFLTNSLEGQCSIQGGSGSNVKAAIVEVGDTIGLFYQSTSGETPEEMEVYFKGWSRIEDDSLLNTSLPSLPNIKFIARA